MKNKENGIHENKEGTQNDKKGAVLQNKKGETDETKMYTMDNILDSVKMGAAYVTENNDDTNTRENTTTHSSISSSHVSNSASVDIRHNTQFTDPMKKKCMKLFYDSINSNIENCDVNKLTVLSYELTIQVFSINADIPKLVRSKCFNLKCKDNHTLCKKVYDGSITPQQFIYMSDEEMKSIELKNEDKKIQEDSLYDIQVPSIKAETDLFKCASCGQRKSTYRQLQTRSADEPMTTFVTCVCGHKWRF